MRETGMRLKKAYVEITNRCNLSCSFCPGTKRSAGEMTPEQFARAAEQIRPYTPYLYLHLMGEPLLHTRLGELLAKAAELGCLVTITTNGTLLHERAQVLLQSPALYKVNISLHSFTGEPQRQADYLQQVTQFAKEGAKREVITVFRLWNLGSEEQAGNAPVERYLADRFGPAVPDRSGFRLAEHIYLQYAEQFQWPDSAAPDGGERRFCHGLRDQIGVLCDGRVVPCCLDHEGELALGNLFEEPLADLLQSPRAIAIYNGFSARKAVEPLCRRCGYATRFQ